MIRKIKFYIKVMIKNPVFLISFLFNMFLLYVQHSVLEYNPFEFTKVFCFGFICSNLFLLITSTFLMYKKYDILDIYENNKFEKQIVIIFSGLIISLITAIPVIITILIFSNHTLPDIFFLKTIIHFLLLWTLSNLISLSIGTTIGSIIRNGFSIIIAFGIYSLFFSSLISISNNIFYNLFNIYDDLTIIYTENYMLVFDCAYFLDKTFILFLSFLVISIGNLFNNKNSKLLKRITLVLILSLILFTNIYLYNYFLFR